MQKSICNVLLFKMSMQEKIRSSLFHSIEASQLEIINESEKHKGHSAYEEIGTGETHFFIKITSSSFIGLSSVEQHRLVYKALENELSTGLHALRLETASP